MVEAEARRRGVRLLDAVERKDLGEVQSLFRDMDTRYESIDVRKHACVFYFVTRASQLWSCAIYAQHEVNVYAFTIPQANATDQNGYTAFLRAAEYGYAS